MIIAAVIWDLHWGNVTTCSLRSACKHHSSPQPLAPTHSQQLASLLCFPVLGGGGAENKTRVVHLNGHFHQSAATGSSPAALTWPPEEETHPDS